MRSNSCLATSVLFTARVPLNQSILSCLPPCSNTPNLSWGGAALVPPTKDTPAGVNQRVSIRSRRELGPVRDRREAIPGRLTNPPQPPCVRGDPLPVAFLDPLF